METTRLFSESIISKIKSAQTAQVIQPVQIGQTDHLNELVFFIKPELLVVGDDKKILNSLKLIEQKFEQFNVKVCGAVIIPGSVLEKHEIMNRHYGFIYQLSRKASEMIDAETRATMFEMLDLQDTGTHQILGGHEFLNTYRSNIESLSQLWFGKGACKLRSGFYFVENTFQGKPIILVNGFHPAQLLHFTRDDHRIFLMLLHTDTDWYNMKFELVGDTFPEKAKPGSIRGRLYARPEAYGQNEVGINSNGVHLSAGPFEAAFEVQNFFGSLLDLDPVKTPPLAIKYAHESGLSIKTAVGLLDNPSRNGRDLFTESENLNTNKAVELAKNWLS